ncbi:family 20 glycosylhydrolase [Microbacterium sp. ASV81]|uniref:beta-N-acetylhexosaminidase n=1 Tax=Microbacterium capsulatum TaxID=3041921 RepID=A0ABU0XIL4_9MICO|nr:family 20 glycosylhydrolase [Microbacterium sp. ASV81]MDQ4214702.1 family 20 glycosylhydrolase [Microbacterium sp. ASV81]
MVLHDAPALIPFPSSVRVGEGSVPLASVRITGEPNAAALLRDDLAERIGADAIHDGGTTLIALAIDPAIGETEGYALEASGDAIRVAGHDAAGLRNGTRTLLQLLRRDDAGWSVPAVSIADAPRFAYRGVMLDVARHFFGVDDVKRFIDRAAGLKFNHLHVHLTDDQGWRIQVDAWPLLADRGGASDASGGSGGFFTKDDYREIVAYAAARHVTVVPEIDLPGHTHAAGVAYPDLVEEPWISEKTITESEQLGQPLPAHGVPYAGWAVGHSSVRIHEERTYGFIQDVLSELAELTPGPYLHIGGDECLGTPAPDFALFFRRVSRIAAATGKTPIAWHEAGAAEDLAEGMIGQYWAGVEPEGAHGEHAAHFAERGGALILSPSDRAYLDMKPSADFPLGLAWAGTVPLRTAYDWEPTAVLDGVPASAILGIEAPLWTETVTTLAEADRLMFPRIAAHAEIGWSAPGGPQRTWDSFHARVAQLAPAWEASGIAVDRATLDVGDHDVLPPTATAATSTEENA